MLWAFIPIAALVTITPGASTAMIIRHSLRGGTRARRHDHRRQLDRRRDMGAALRARISALVAASEAAFLALKIAGAAVLVWLGVGSLRRTRAGLPEPGEASAAAHPRALRDGLVTSLSNPKLAVFFVALFPQFVQDRADVLPTTLLMAALIVVFDLVWYGTLAWAVSHAKRAFVRSRLARWSEAVTGTVLVALGVRVALEQR